MIAGLDWRMDIRDLSHTAGAGVNILLLNEKLTLTPELIYEGTKTAYDVYAGSSLSRPQAIPDLKTMRYNVNLSGRYKLTEHFTLRAGYLYESFKSNDWAFDNISLGNTASLPTTLLILSERVQDYIAHMGSISIAYNW